MNIQLDPDQFKDLIQEELQKYIPDHEPTPYMMDVLTACGYLSISRPTLAEMVKKCHIDKYKVGKKVLYRREDIEFLADERCREAKKSNYDLLD